MLVKFLLPDYAKFVFSCTLKFWAGVGNVHEIINMK